MVYVLLNGNYNNVRMRKQIQESLDNKQYKEIHMKTVYKMKLGKVLYCLKMSLEIRMKKLCIASSSEGPKL